MTQFGIILTSLTIVIGIIFLILGIISRIYIQPKIKTKLHVFFMWLPKVTIGLFAFIWFLIFRWTIDLKLLITNGPGEGGILYSKVLLLDLCPFVFVVISLFMIFDYKSKFINIVAIWGLIGATVTIVGDGWFTEYKTTILNYIFFGDSEGEFNNKLYYFMHAIMLFASLYFLGSSNRFNFYRTLTTHIVVVLYLCYVLIIVHTLNVTRNVTGLVEFDWNDPAGEYHKVSLIFNMKAPNVMFLSYFLVWLSMIIIIAIKNECHRPKPLMFWPKTFYNHWKWLNDVSLKYCKFKKKLFRLNN